MASKRMYQPWNQIEWYWKMTKYPTEARKFQVLHNEIYDKVSQKTKYDLFDSLFPV